jgi:AcrR family transcriptional regulator
MADKIAARMPAIAPKSYHHGDLARVLAEAAEALVRETGVHTFSLRECARRANVAHSAPGHHYGDVAGLLTEVAARGFERLTQALRRDRAETGGEVALMRISRSYISFALSDPVVFSLMFHSDRIDRGSARFQTAGDTAFAELALAVAEARGEPAPDEQALRFAWAAMHGVATLLIDGPLVPVGGDRRGGSAALAAGTIDRLVFAVTRFEPAPGDDRIAR